MFWSASYNSVLDLNPIRKGIDSYGKINEKKNATKKCARTFMSENLFQIHIVKFEKSLFKTLHILIKFRIILEVDGKFPVLEQ